MSLSPMNVTLAAQIAEWAYDDSTHPEWGRWNQSVWGEKRTDRAVADPNQVGACGSSFCIAGQAVVQTGYRMLFDATSWDYSAETIDGNYPANEFGASRCVPQVFDHLDNKGRPVYKDVGEPESISDVAARVLGLTYREQNSLFSGSNDIRAIIGQMLLFAGARGQTLTLSDEVREVGLEYLEVNGVESVDSTWGLYADDGEECENALSNLKYAYPDIFGTPEPETCDACGQALPV